MLRSCCTGAFCETPKECTNLYFECLWDASLNNLNLEISFSVSCSKVAWNCGEFSPKETVKRPFVSLIEITLYFSGKSSRNISCNFCSPNFWVLSSGKRLKMRNDQTYISDTFFKFEISAGATNEGLLLKSLIIKTFWIYTSSKAFSCLKLGTDPLKSFEWRSL